MPFAPAESMTYPTPPVESLFSPAEVFILHACAGRKYVLSSRKLDQSHHLQPKKFGQSLSLQQKVWSRPIMCIQVEILVSSYISSREFEQYPPIPPAHIVTNCSLSPAKKSLSNLVCSVESLISPTRSSRKFNQCQLL